MRHTKSVVSRYLSIALVLSVLGASAHAGQLFTRDLVFGSGDAAITLDQTTGLEWLDWTQTTSISYESMLTRLAPGGDYEGWQHATSSQWSTFANNLGFSGFPSQVYDGGALYSQAVSFVGETRAAGTHQNYTGFDQSYGILAEQQPIFTGRKTARLSQDTSTHELGSVVNHVWSNPTMHIPYTGHALVRTSANAFSANGGYGATGGTNAVFENVATAGEFTAPYSSASSYQELLDLIGTEPLAGLIAHNNFVLFGEYGPQQLWDVDYSGEFDGPVSLTFSYDETLLTPWYQAREELLGIWHYGAYGSGGSKTWRQLTGDVDSVDNTITVTVDGFSPFLLGLASGSEAPATAVPEPSTFALLGIGSICMTLAGVRRRRKQAGQRPACFS